MQSCPNAVIALIATYGNLPDAIHLEHVLRTQLPQRCRDVFQQRLRRRINECGINAQDFFDVVRRDKAIVAGSIHLEILLGKDSFKAQDIDIFVMRKRDEPFPFTTLHRFLFEHSTGLVSSPDIALTPFERFEADRHVKSVNVENIESPNMMKYTYTNGEQRLFCNPASGPKIMSVFNYTVNSTVFQLITLNADAVNADEFDLDKYVCEWFDFRACTSTYDGKNYKLRFLSDVVERALVLNGDFTQRAMMFSEDKADRHKARIGKYLARGFKPHNKDLQVIRNFGLEYGLLVSFCNNMNQREEAQGLEEKVKEDSEDQFELFEPDSNCEKVSNWRDLLNDATKKSVQSAKTVMNLILRQHKCRDTDLKKKYYRICPRRSSRLQTRKRKFES